VTESPKPESGQLDDALIAAALGASKPRKPDPTLPSPRLPEAAYYYVLTLIEAAVLLGIWGFMQRGINEVITRGPGEQDSFWVHFKFNLWSTWEGLQDQCMTRPWLAAGILLGSAAIFVPRTARGRKRMATLVTGLVVACFATLIALQFMEDINMMSARSVY